MDELAKEVYNLIKGLPPESAKIVAGMLVSEAVHYDIGDYDVSKAYMDWCNEQSDVVKRSLIRQYVSKREKGEDVSSIVAMADAISKAAESTEQRRENARHEHRSHGRFAPGRWKKTEPGQVFHHTIEDNLGNTQRMRASTVNTMEALARAQAAHIPFEPAQFREGGDSNAFVPGVANARRVAQGANFLQATVGGYLPSSAQIGLHTASFLGHNYSEAQQAFGPAMDRAKYRYQGVERKLDPRLATAIRQDRADARKNNLGFSDQVLSVGTETDARRPGGAGRETETTSNVIQYFQNHLPKEQMAYLHRAGGHQPPSEGVIIARDGKVGGQMVGKGDDWYLPFDLKNLGELKGGSYIRTRTHGGLTTEDIYTGLMSGARRMTVVSHNGVFTITFDPTLRGSRRYSQTAREMTHRYGQLLDAAKLGKVRVHDVREIDPAKLTDLMAASEGDPENFRQRLNSFYQDPEPSDDMRRQWTHHYIEAIAARQDTKDGHTMTADEFVSQRIIPAMEAQTLRGSVIPGVEDPFPISAEDVKAEAEADYALHPENGLQAYAEQIKSKSAMDSYKIYMRNQLLGYKESFRPLELNGEGYAFAAEALKEQFPYFIQNTTWTQRRKGGTDKGYVKPRFNRSASVREGYFDDSILGYSKVPADRTRYQNARVQRTVEQGWRPGGAVMPSPEIRISGEGAQRAPEGERPEETRPPGGPQAGPGPHRVDKRREADLELVKHILGQERFAQNFTGPADYNAQELKGADFQYWRKHPWMDHEEPRYKNFSLDLPQFEAMPDDQLHREVGKMVKASEEDHMFDDLDKQLVARHKSSGGPIRPSDVDVLDIDPDSNEEYDFGDEFQGGRTREAYSKLWARPIHRHVLDQIRSDHGIEHINDPGMEDALTEYIADEQESGDRARAADDRPGAQNNRNNITNAMRLRQLVRYWHDVGDGGGTSSSRGGPMSIGPTNIAGGGGSQGTAIPVRHGSPSSSLQGYPKLISNWN